MELATKALLITASVLIVIVITASGVLILKNINENQKSAEKVGEGLEETTIKTSESLKSDLGQLNNNSEGEMLIKIESITVPSSGDYIYVGDTINIAYTIYPENATNKKITFISSDPNIATVDKNGQVTGKSEGTAIITIQSNDGSGVTQIYGVMVSLCFSKGTKVLTEYGLMNIEDITAGMNVYSMNMETNTIELKEVIETFKNDVYTNMCKVYVGENSIIESTAGHNYYEKTKGWVEAQKLQEGDILKKSDGEEVIVNHVEVTEEKTNNTVYNLKIKDNHNYFVSEEKVLVHNACAPVP